MRVKDYFGCKSAKRFRFKTKGIEQRDTLADKMLSWAGVRRRRVATIVYEHLLYQIASTSCPQGPWTSSAALASRTGLSPDAVTRALRTLAAAQLIDWVLHKRDGAPTRHFRLLQKARILLRNALRSIRQIKQPEPPNPLTTFKSPEALQKGEPQTQPKTVTEPAKKDVGRQKDIGRGALAALRRARGG
jgi:DNA-binding MarR family transcriptional regulator